MFFPSDDLTLTTVLASCDVKFRFNIFWDYESLGICAIPELPVATSIPPLISNVPS